ncbi:hypothetical protein A2833_01560 [Candidatus Azambacteria bacterium RIFCSPHIGHO2_01_FULL_44_55]|uniref:Rod shape-determining protein MreD n=1 Tax=Candidatus Azambacteria bacterium RIFCSPLOWO2_02_FULL_44_14 TaxID=1797306 RepID=A0A1F5CBW5_9BACT|nr:MAG: hypothetical protein A3A18_00995 [Candidatus Azambacteria bacterium RIFCSPLOWO2_01_FULL_44_84]OGD33209.1 MAG: hypothetical protein A3C78_03050 [Candidatus Azambacteria bacterium RIFCSPHIGHO2_02_FULL_45_18]OGD40314.1 MAG: hypothetical protein A3I30_03410 [Candidatus Azambacteria bacterium RIFCSPLOWO2_02_FULL_44_14]OGD40736.1 MAG: hypothetical protein A2833_01560 [Candidatus Azambacteria bacterium RIFCSPHIGHO2_01_FULL_44_55]
MRKFFLFIILLACAIIQLSFLNPSYMGVNLILAFVIALALTQEISFTLPAVWFAGFIIDLNKTLYFGISSLVFITLVVIITLGHRFFLSSRRIKNIIILGILAVIIERILFLVFVNLAVLLKEGFYESPASFFNTFGFLLELIITPIIILGFFKLLFKDSVQEFKQEWQKNYQIFK